MYSLTYHLDKPQISVILILPKGIQLSDKTNESEFSLLETDTLFLLLILS